MILPIAPGRRRESFGGGREDDPLQPSLVDVIIPAGTAQETVLKDYEMRRAPSGWRAWCPQRQRPLLSRRGESKPLNPSRPGWAGPREVIPASLFPRQRDTISPPPIPTHRLRLAKVSYEDSVTGFVATARDDEP